MSRPKEQLFERGLEALAAGESMASVLAGQPDYVADDLHAMLTLADQLARTSTAPVPASTVRQSRIRLLDHLQSIEPPTRRLPLALAWLPRLTAAVATVAVVSFGGIRLLSASAESLPGEPLYGLKRAAEGLQLAVAGPEAQYLLTLEFDQRRLNEADRLIALGRQARVEFEAELQSRSEHLWRIGGFAVRPPADLSPSFKTEIGDTLSVEGVVAANGQIQAQRLERVGYLLYGSVDSIHPDQWRIAGRIVRTAATTHIDPGLRTGDEVAAYVHDKLGGLVAVSIRRLDPPEPIPSAEPFPPQPPAPTATPTPLPEQPPVLELNDDDWLAGTERHFVGFVEAQTSNRWRVAGRWLLIIEATDLDPGLAIGDRVEVWALQPQADEMIALRIEAAPIYIPPPPQPESEGGSGESEEPGTEEVEFSGEVTSTGGSQWTIGGKTVQVTEETDIVGEPGVGDLVNVEATRYLNGDLVAGVIERIGGE